MKIIKYMAVAAAALTLFSACRKDETLGLQNKGKERPEVTLTAGQTSNYAFVLNAGLSADIQQFAIVVYENGEDVTAPDAYSLVTGSVVDGIYSEVYNASDYEGGFSIVVGGAATETELYENKEYVVYASAISATGLLSKVSELTVSTTPVGMYKLNYTNLNADPEKPQVVNQNSGQPFDVMLETLILDGGTEFFLMTANWFNIAPAGKIMAPILIGIPDRKTNTCSFTYTLDDEGNLTEDVYGVAYMYFNQEAGQVLAFFGGGETGLEPLTVTFDEKGVLKTASDCEYGICQLPTGQYVATFDALTNATFTPVEAETAAVTASAKSFSALAAGPLKECSQLIFKK